MTTDLTGAPALPSPAAPAPTPGFRHPRAARLLLLATVFVCAACGLVYELALVALGSYLIGDAVGQASVVLSVMVFSMGVGSLLAKPLQRSALLSFAVVECALGLVGGLSVLALYAGFAWLDLYRPALVVVAAVVGALVGAEIPLLMVLLQRIRRQEAGSAVADLFAADYVGALLGGLAFPFLLLPAFGQLRGALLVGVVNVVAAGAAVALFRHDLRRTTGAALLAGAAAVLTVLVAAFLAADRLEISAREALYDDPVIHAERTAYQEIVLTRSVSPGRGDDDLRLFLNGDLQFSSKDEYRYHESLVHPAMAGRHERVLILGGGDGLAAREVLRYRDVRRVVEVELDPAMIRLAREHESVRRLNRDSLKDPRIEVVTADAFGWLRDNRERFDVVVVDMPDPDATSTAKLYSTEFYGLAARALAIGGRMVVQAGSPYFAPDEFWCVATTLEAAGLRTRPFHVDVPTFGDWGFVLAAPSPPRLRLAPDAPPLRSLDADTLSAAAVFPPDRARRDVAVSTLTRPVILDYARAGWQDY